MTGLIRAKQRVFEFCSSIGTGSDQSVMTFAQQDGREELCRL